MLIGKIMEPTEDKIWVQVEVSAQITQYEPVKIVLGQSISICPDDDPDEMRKNLMHELLKQAISETERARNRPSDLYPPRKAPPETTGRRRRF